MAEWQDLTDELDIWRDRGLQATFWWRDDDAVAFTPPLRRMLEIARNHDAPLAVAVVPNGFEPELCERLNARADVSVLQHGFDHTNRAPADEKKSEFPKRRNLQDALQDIESGRKALQAFTGGEAVLVPPWNRIAPAVREALPGLGFAGVSLFGARTQNHRAKGLSVINTHVDIIDWHGTRGFVGSDAAITAILTHLQSRRAAMHDIHEATGLLSHHLVHDEDCWHFIEDFLHHVNAHEAARPISIAEALSP